MISSRATRRRFPSLIGAVVAAVLWTHPAALSAQDASLPGVSVTHLGPDRVMLVAKLARNPERHVVYRTMAMPSVLRLSCSRASHGKIDATVDAGFSLKTSDSEQAIPAMPVRVEIDGRVRLEQWMRRWWELTPSQAFLERLDLARTASISVAPGCPNCVGSITLTINMTEYPAARKEFAEACRDFEK